VRILLAEDDRILGDGLARALRQSGYAVDWVETGPAADAALAAHRYDLLILDLGLPRLPGLEVLSRLRARDQRTPVLILTALDGTEDRVRGLDGGADDYLTKPFELAELEARVRALLRRGLCGAPRVIALGSLAFDPTARQGFIAGKPIDLSARELALLEALIGRPGRLVSKRQLLEHLYEWGGEVSENAIEVYVHRLRRKLEGSGVRIHTVRGLGYSIEAENAR
jgi:DNA-binding response OmpR family regulator